MHAGTVIGSFRTLLRGKITRQFTLVSDPTCAPSVEKAIVGMQTFGGTREGKTLHIFLDETLSLIILNTGVKARKGVLKWGRWKARRWKRR